MDYYNSKDFTTMQQQAIERVQEMQKRSKSIVGGGETAEVPQKINEPNNKQMPHKANKKKNGELFNLGGIKIDEEKALIALMIYILYKNGADIKLLLGLGYLLI
ncbi:MAG: hypothetical protein ACI4RC_02675 [Oscillospiraceae bacterium]